MLQQLAHFLERHRRFRKALAYNREYTFSVYTDAPHSWMCPSCNQVQRAHSTSKFFGPQFDACCGLPQGARNERRFALPYALI